MGPGLRAALSEVPERPLAILPPRRVGSHELRLRPRNPRPLQTPIAPHLDADLGYRYFVVNDQVGDFAYHVKLSGLVFGGTYVF